MHQWNPLKELWSQKEDGLRANKVTKNSYFVPSVLQFSIHSPPLLMFLTSVSLLFHLTNCGHNRFLLAGTFSGCAKTCFYEENSHRAQNNSSHHCSATLTVFVRKCFHLGGKAHKRGERGPLHCPKMYSKMCI